MVLKCIALDAIFPAASGLVKLTVGSAKFCKEDNIKALIFSYVNLMTMFMIYHNHHIIITMNEHHHHYLKT